MDGSLLFSAFVFLAAASLLVPVSKLSGLGSVIGYLIAGVLIGPDVLGFIRDPETILHFSEFGVVMMLFLIGLELQPRSLWEMRAKLLGLGGAQVGVTAALIAGIGVAAGLVMGEAVVVGMALALSSTAIALQIMQDRAVLREPAGEAGFSVLLFQDVIVIAMIAVIPFLATMGPVEGLPMVTEEVAHGGAGSHGAEPHAGDDHGGGHGGMEGPTGVWRILAIFGVFAGMILAGRLLLRPLFRLIARSEVRETFTAISLLLVVGAALLMQWLGLSAALGAFIAGIVLADSEYRHQLERDIEPFKALLLGLFFMSVGMSLDFGTLAANPLLVVGLVIGLMVLKFAVLMGVGRVAGLALPHNLLFATLLCQAGEFGFVIFQFAQAEGALSPTTATILTAVIALSMALTPLLLIVYDRFVAPRFVPPKKTGETARDEDNPVLILGYGRVGQVVERLLTTQGIGCTLIDNDGDHIEFVKQFGNRVFFGDASDMDLLRVAGADHAKVIVVAVDDIEAGNEAAREVQTHFPEARVIARAFGRNQLYELMEIGVDFAERETVRSSLAMGRKALEFLGYSEARARRLSDRWLEHDYAIAQRDYELRGDLDALAERADQNRALMKTFLDQDMADMDDDERAEE